MEKLLSGDPILPDDYDFLMGMRIVNETVRSYLIGPTELNDRYFIA